MDISVLRELQAWYLRQCDGDWEHQYGVTIGTLDNPGWTVKIDLNETHLEDRPFDQLRDDYDSDTNWMICRRIESRFDAACGPERLVDVIRVFLDWAASSNKPMQTDDPSGRR